MKSVIAVIVLALIGAGVYYFFIADSAAYTTYKQFSTAMLRGQSDEAKRLATSDDVLSGQSEDRTQTIGNMPAEALTGVHYTLESETKGADDTETIVAVLAVSFNPPGATSAMGAMTSKFRQTVELKKTADGWRVSSFQDQFVETRNWKGEKE